MRVSPLDLKILELTPETEDVDVAEVEVEAEVVVVAAGVADTAETPMTTKDRTVTETHMIKTSGDTRARSTMADLMTVNLEAAGRAVMKARRTATRAGAIMTNRRVSRSVTSRASKSKKRLKPRTWSKSTSLVITRNLRRKK